MIISFYFNNFYQYQEKLERLTKWKNDEQAQREQIENDYSLLQLKLENAEKRIKFGADNSILEELETVKV